MNKIDKTLLYIGTMENGDVLKMRHTEYSMCDVGSDYYYESYTKSEIKDIVEKRWSKNNLAVAKVYPEDDCILFEIYDKKGRHINEIQIDIDDKHNIEYFKNTFKIPKEMKERLKKRLKMIE